MLKLIIVDDEVRVCQLIAKLIPWEELGIQIVGIAYNGLEAYEQIKRENPHIVITDIRMPGYNGLELIKRSKEYNEDISFIIVSGHRDFEYAKDAIKQGAEDYILKPIIKEDLINIVKKIIEKKVKNEKRLNHEISLKNELEKSKDIIREQFAANLIQTDCKVNVENIKEINDNFFFSFGSGIYQGIIIKIDNVKDEKIDFAYTIRIMEKAGLIIEKSLKELCTEYIVRINGLRIVCILNYEIPQKRIKRDIHNLFEEMVNFIRPYRDYEITMSVGSTENSINELYISYDNALLADRYRIIKGTNKIIYYNECLVQVEKKPYMTWEDAEKKIVHAIEKFNIQEIIQKIKELFYPFIQARETFNPNEIFILCDKIIHMILRSVEDIGFKEDGIREAILEHIDNAVSIRDVEKKLIQSIENYLKIIMASKKMKEYKPIRIAKEYISEKYMEHIKLEDIAELVELNPVYFSVIFKNETGINFKDYVIQYRIDRAKELLKTTNETMLQIAEKVGYKDARYFSKLFSKIVGIKPNEYRRIYG